MIHVLTTGGNADIYSERMVNVEDMELDLKEASMAQQLRETSHCVEQTERRTQTYVK